jgi:hypothetical protein
MANQGYPDEGSDKRLIPGLGWLQKALIKKQSKPPDAEHIINRTGLSLWLQLWPPFVMLEHKRADGTWRQMRLGWTYREGQKYDIPGAAIKKEQSLEPDYAHLRDDK